MDRKKKLRLIQMSLLLLGSLIVFFTYLQKNEKSEESIISIETQEKIKKKLANKDSKVDVFYDVSYSGLDLSGNRYILRSKEAINNKSQLDLVDMKIVNAFFYFKDGTILEVQSDAAIYNNKTLDMSFDGNVKALYEGSTLFADKAEYSNLKNYLTISSQFLRRRKIVNDYLTKNRRYIMKDYSLFIFKVQWRLKQLTI